MATIQLDSKNFTDVIGGADTIVIDFWASWCQPCMRFGPVFEAASEKYEDITFAKLDTEANQDIAQALEIQSIPTLMVVKNGMLLYREPGALTAKQLDGLITEVENLDVEALKAEAAKEADAAGDTDSAVDAEDTVTAEADESDSDTETADSAGATTTDETEPKA